MKHRLGRALNVPPISKTRVFQTDVSDQLNIFCTEQELNNLISREDCKVAVEQSNFSSPQAKIFYESNIELDNRKVVGIAVETQTQSTNIWKIHRSRRITASSCYSLYTYLKNANPDWESKINRYWSIKNIKTTAISHGQVTESKAFDCYVKKRNSSMKKTGLVIKTNDCWFASSPDGVDPVDRVVLEIKCPIIGVDSLVDEMIEHETVKKYLKKSSSTNDFTLNPNHQYYCQVQLNMWVLNCLKCDFIVYSLKADDFALVEVAFDKHYVENVVNSLK